MNDELLIEKIKNLFKKSSQVSRNIKMAILVKVILSLSKGAEAIAHIFDTSTNAQHRPSSI